MPSNRPSTTWVALLRGPGSALVRLVSTLQHVPYRASSRISNVFVFVPDFTIPPTDRASASAPASASSSTVRHLI